MSVDVYLLLSGHKGPSIPSSPHATYVDLGSLHQDRFGNARLFIGSKEKREQE
jgi:hypothetical protein